MPEDVNLSINGRSQVPPGFRFHPTEEELLHYYLRKKVAYEKIDLDVIRDVDLNKLEPWDIQERCKIGSTPQNDWYFFSHKDKKYPTGTRTNRATAAGFWKATGRDKIIYSGFRRIGLRKTLVFYKGRAPHGQKSDWIMHEYRLDDNTTLSDHVTSCSVIGEGVSEEGWVVCRVFRKKNYQKSIENPRLVSSASKTDYNSKQQLPLINSVGDHHGVLDQILLYMGRNNNNSACKIENQSFNNINSASSTGLNERFIHLPRLDSPSPVHMVSGSTSCYDPYDDQNLMDSELSSSAKTTSGLNDWVTLDRLVASQLNGQVLDKQLSNCFNDPNGTFSMSPNDDDIDELQQDFNSKRQSDCNQINPVYCNENDLWSFATRSSSSPSSSDPLCHLSV